MGGSNTIIRFVEQITGQPRVEKLYFNYVGDNLNPQSFWSDVLDRLRIELDVRRDVLDGVVSSIPATGRVVAIANHPYGLIDGLSWEVFAQHHYALAANANAFSAASHQQYRQPETNIQSGYVSENAKAVWRQRRVYRDAYLKSRCFGNPEPSNLFFHKSDLTVAQPAYVLLKIFCGNVSD